MSIPKKPLQNILISRTDSIGDVVLTLPVATALKKMFPGITIGFLGSSYTKSVVSCCASVDVFIDKNEFLSQDVRIAGQRPEAILHVFPVKEIAQRAKALGIPLRIGTTNRLYHWFYCNQLTQLSRKNSELHESQLNLKLLRSLGLTHEYSLQEIPDLYHFTKIPNLDPTFFELLHPHKFHVVLHPRSQGSAREWGITNFIQLIQQADPEKFQFFITGTAKEREGLQELFDTVGNLVTDLTGKMPLDQLIAFIAHIDGLVANSTGPLHIAAALGKHALGIYPPIRPMHPGRWAPIGQHARYFVASAPCEQCRKKPSGCICMQSITPSSVLKALEEALLLRNSL